MLTNQDIDELLVMAELEVNDNIEAALEDYYRPDVEREAEILWAGLPESVRQDRKSTRLNSSHPTTSRMPSSA